MDGHIQTVEGCGIAMAKQIYMAWNLLMLMKIGLFALFTGEITVPLKCF